MKHWTFPPPPTQRISTRLPGAVCSFCGQDEELVGPYWTGRIVNIQHKRRTICESCIETADEMAACAALARQAKKARPRRRHSS